MKKNKAFILLFIISIVISCAPVNKHIWAPAEPEKQLKRTDYSSMDLILTSFQVENLDEDDDEGDINYLRTKFLRYIAATNNFRNIRDINLNARTPDDEAYVTMEVVVEPDYSSYRTVILDIPFFWPFPFVWPISPLWGDGKVNTNLAVFDPNGIRITSFDSFGEEGYLMILYPYYRKAPIEEALKEAYQSSFEKSSTSLKSNQEIIVAHMDSLNLLQKPLLATAVGRADQKSIAVLPLNAFGVSPTESSALTNRLTTELFKTGLYDVVERNKIKDILDEQGFQLSGCTTSECLVEAGKLLNVELMLGGSISKVGKLYSLEVRIIDVETARLLSVASADIRGDIGDVMMHGVRDAVAKLSGKKR